MELKHPEVNQCLQELELQHEKDHVLHMDSAWVVSMSLFASSLLGAELLWLMFGTSTEYVFDLHFASHGRGDACCFVEGVIPCCCLPMVEKKKWFKSLERFKSQ